MNDPMAAAKALMLATLDSSVQQFIADHHATTAEPGTRITITLKHLASIELTEDSDGANMLMELSDTLNDILTNVEVPAGEEYLYAHCANLFQRAADAFAKLALDSAELFRDRLTNVAGTKKSLAILKADAAACRTYFDTCLTMNGLVDQKLTIAQVAEFLPGIPLTTHGESVVLDIPRIYESKPGRPATKGTDKTYKLTLVVDGKPVAVPADVDRTFTREVWEAFNMKVTDFLTEFKDAGGRHDGKTVTFRNEKVSIHPV